MYGETAAFRRDLYSSYYEDQGVKWFSEGHRVCVKGKSRLPRARLHTKLHVRSFCAQTSHSRALLYRIHLKNERNISSKYQLGSANMLALALKAELEGWDYHT